MKSIFVFEKESGKYIEELIEENNFLPNNFLKEFFNREFFARKEETTTEGKNINRKLYMALQKPGDKDFGMAVFDELKKNNFDTYVFDGEKREIARMLVSAPLEKNERIEFFNNLEIVSNSEVSELKSGMLDLLKNI